ncbi:MAG: energy transducer TonB [Bacteroidota bacterium]
MRSFRKLSFLLLLLFSGFAVAAQKKFLEGWVNDDTGKPLRFAFINIYSKGQYLSDAYTDERGHYQTYIDANTDSIECIKRGYKDAYEKMEGNSIINFFLEEKKPVIKYEKYSFSVEGTHIYTAAELRKRTADSIALDKKIKEFEKEKEKEEEKTLFTKVEIESNYKGGPTSINNYFERTIHYFDSTGFPEAKGTVKVKFLIKEKNKVSNVTLVKGVNKYADSIVLHAVSKMTEWNLGMVNGREIESYKELSVKFNIQAIIPENLKIKKKKGSLIKP